MFSSLVVPVCDCRFQQMHLLKGMTRHVPGNVMKRNSVIADDLKTHSNDSPLFVLSFLRCSWNPPRVRDNISQLWTTCKWSPRDEFIDGGQGTNARDIVCPVTRGVPSTSSVAQKFELKLRGPSVQGKPCLTPVTVATARKLMVCTSFTSARGKKSHTCVRVPRRSSWPTSSSPPGFCHSTSMQSW